MTRIRDDKVARTRLSIPVLHLLVTYQILELNLSLIFPKRQMLRDLFLTSHLPSKEKLYSFHPVLVPLFTGDVFLRFILYLVLNYKILFFALISFLFYALTYNQPFLTYVCR